MKKKKFFETEVIDCRETSKNSGIFCLEIARQKMDTQPGQFVMLRPLEAKKDSPMPRPFSVAYQWKNSIALLIKKAGRNTELFSKLTKGDKVTVSGPHGNPIPTSSTENAFVLVGGGIGAAPLLNLATELRKDEKSVTVLFGGKNQSHILDSDTLMEYGCKVRTITEEGIDNTGFVTDLLQNTLKSLKIKPDVIACGPAPMLKKVAEISKDNNSDCLVLLEEIMACGIGSCKSCAVFGIDGTVKHLCIDGPALDANWIDWKRLLPDNSTHPIPSRHKMGKRALETLLLGKGGKNAILMDYPIMNASGCLGIEAIENEDVDITHAGALVTKGVTLEPRTGNDMPRVCEVPYGMINSIGLENIGMERFTAEELPRWLKTGKPIIVNMSGSSVEEFAELAGKLENTGISGIEINVSCPNKEQKDEIFGLDPRMTFDAVSAARKSAPHTFLITKISPMAKNCTEIARAGVEAGSDAISGINTLLGMEIDPYTRKPKIAMGSGGMSGPAIRPRAVKIIRDLFEANLGVPIIGMGGITCGHDAMQFILAGANAVAVGTSLFSNPDIFSEISPDLEKFTKYHNVNHILNLVGQVDN